MMDWSEAQTCARNAVYNILTRDLGAGSYENYKIVPNIYADIKYQEFCSDVTRYLKNTFNIQVKLNYNWRIDHKKDKVQDFITALAGLIQGHGLPMDTGGGA